MSSILENRIFQRWFAVVGIPILALYLLTAYILIPFHDWHVREEKEARALAKPYNIYEDGKYLLLKGQATDDNFWIAITDLQKLMEPGHCDVVNGPHNYGGTVYVTLWC